MKKLEEHIIKNCYQNRTYNFMHAQKCEDFHVKNDFKLNILKNYFGDHIVRHLNDYESCWKNADFDDLKTNEEKDRAFLDCHNRWISNL